MQRFKTLISIFLFLFVLTAFQPAKADPQPLAVQDFSIEYSIDSVNIVCRVYSDPVVLENVYSQIDTDRNGDISDTEVKTLTQETLKKYFTARLNNRDVVLEQVSFQVLKKNQVQSMEDNFLNITYKVINPVILETNSFFFSYDKKFVTEDGYGDLIVFQDNIASNTDKLERISTNQDLSDRPTDYLVDYKILNFNNLIQATSAPQPVRTENEPSDFKAFLASISTKSTELTNLARNYNFKQGGIKLLLLSLIIMFLAGALHAVTPGHGKSMMAAFLIGKRETKFIDVMILGLSITLSHTLMIYLIGFILWGLKMTSSAPKVTYYIEKASSILLIILAINLFRGAFKAYKSSKKVDSLHEHIQEDGELVHDHGFGPHSHAPGKIKIRSRWDLFYAGLSGGMVPCLDALSILFVAVNIGKIGIGLVMIFFFSLGLASAIILIGLFLIYGKNKLNLEEKFGNVAQFYAPMISGVIIIVIALIYLLK